MTTPNDTDVPDGNQENNGETDLGESIDELENLIDDAKNGNINKYDDNIPILDDLVSPEEIDRTVKMSDLANTIDEKLNDELNALLDILKTNIKDSILDEINTRLTTTDKDSDEPPKDNPE